MCGWIGGDEGVGCGGGDACVYKGGVMCVVVMHVCKGGGMCGVVMCGVVMHVCKGGGRCGVVMHVCVEKSLSIKTHRVTDPLFKNLSLTLVRLLVKWSL